MTSKLDQLNAMTVVVADTGDLEAVRRLAPQDCTTNPSLVLKAMQSPAMQDKFTQTVARLKGQSNAVAAIVQDLTVGLGAELAAIVPGRVSTEVDARLSFDKEGSIAKARALIDAYAKLGVGADRILIKLAATWEGIQAAAQLQQAGIHCPQVLDWSQAQEEVALIGAAIAKGAPCIEVGPCDQRLFGHHLAHLLQHPLGLLQPQAIGQDHYPPQLTVVFLGDEGFGQGLQGKSRDQ